VNEIHPFDRPVVGDTAEGWVAAAEAGDRVSEPDFDTLYGELYPRVVYFFEKRGLSREDAEDLAQDTFVRVRAALGNLRQERAATGWVFTIAANLWRNRFRYQQAERRKGDLVTIAPGSPTASSVDPSRTLELAQPPIQERSLHAIQILERLRAAVLRLPERMRQTFLLHFDQDRSYLEIAILMGVSVQAVKSQIHQARHRLQEILEEESDEHRS
jgi:RNA polymerase sigma-70 factor, ECF subfamily